MLFFVATAAPVYVRLVCGCVHIGCVLAWQWGCAAMSGGCRLAQTVKTMANLRDKRGKTVGKKERGEKRAKDEGERGEILGGVLMNRGLLNRSEMKKLLGKKAGKHLMKFANGGEQTNSKRKAIYEGKNKKSFGQKFGDQIVY